MDVNGGQSAKDYATLLNEVRQNQKSLFWRSNERSDLQPKEALISAIKDFLSANHHQLQSCTDNDLAEKIYNDLAEDSILTGPLKDIWVEKIRIQSWDDVHVSFINGQSVLIDGFNSPGHATEVIKRLLEKEGMKTDGSIITGRMRNGDQIAAFFPPCILDGAGTCCTIQKQRKRSFSAQDYIANDFASQRELDFLALAVRYGLSILIVGPPESGKTAFLEFLLSTAPEKSAFVLEQGFREIRAGQSILIPEEMSPADCTAHVSVLCPDVIGYDCNLCFAQDVALKGIPILAVVRSISPFGGLRAAAEQWRSQKNMLDAQTALNLTGVAFPLIVSLCSCGDRKKRIASISECCAINGSITLKTLWEFQVDKTQVRESGTVIYGSHRQIFGCSEVLLQRMTLNGITPEETNIFKKEENDDVGRESNREACSRPAAEGNPEE